MDHHGHAKGRGHRIDSDIVMGRPDPAGREQIVVLCPQLVHCLADPRMIIGNDTHFAEPNPLLIQPNCKLSDVFVLRAPGEDLVSDYDERCGPRLR